MFDTFINGKLNCWYFIHYENTSFSTFSTWIWCFKSLYVITNCILSHYILYIIKSHILCFDVYLLSSNSPIFMTLISLESFFWVIFRITGKAFSSFVGKYYRKLEKCLFVRWRYQAGIMFNRFSDNEIRQFLYENINSNNFFADFF